MPPASKSVTTACQFYFLNRLKSLLHFSPLWLRPDHASCPVWISLNVSPGWACASNPACTCLQWGSSKQKCDCVASVVKIIKCCSEGQKPLIFSGTLWYPPPILPHSPIQGQRSSQVQLCKDPWRHSSSPSSARAAPPAGSVGWRSYLISLGLCPLPSQILTTRHLLRYSL